MALSTKAIKTRIRSIRNTGKITKAMELVSATKMRRAVKATLASRPYAGAAAETAAALSILAQNGESPFFLPRTEIKKVAVVLFSSSRALCGSFNTQVLNAARAGLQEKFGSNLPEVLWITVGQQGANLLAKANEKIYADFAKAETSEESEELMVIARMLLEGFLTSQFDEVFIAYTDFHSVLKQTPRLKLVLPIGQELLKEESAGVVTEFKFEPSQEEVLSYLVPRFIEIELYQSLLETNASIHSARMMTMKNASDAAGDLVDDLVLAGNQLRQAMITREIAEIAGGKAALAIDE